MRGEIWFAEFPTDPPGKGKRPAVIVSLDGRNLHPRAVGVLIVPLTTSIHKASSMRLLLLAGDTGLQSDSLACPEDITLMPKTRLHRPIGVLRRLSNQRICELSEMVRMAMGCQD